MKTQVTTHLIGLMAILGMMSAMVFVPQQEAEAAQPTTGVSVDIPATVNGVATTLTFEIDRFVSQNGQLVAVGTLTDAAGTALGSANIPTAVTGTCEVLHLELGPLDLNLLGLVIHLDKVVLDITAESGPGNLLGNLLCSVAGLLDGGAPTNALARLLNQILSILG